MLSIEDKLFDTYGESILEQLDSFPENEVIDSLNALPVAESRRIELYDQLQHLYFQWSADAFAIGLHLGLSLLSHDVRRPRSEKA